MSRSRTRTYVRITGLTLSVLTLSPVIAADRVDATLKRAARQLGVEKVKALELDAKGSWYQFGRRAPAGRAK